MDLLIPCHGETQCWKFVQKSLIFKQFRIFQIPFSCLLFSRFLAVCLHFGQLFVYFSRLRCIVWDLSRSFLLRLAISIFTVILIYTMAQVNTFTCSVDSCEAALEECEARGTCHRICPLPQYIVLSCMLGFLAVAVFLRMPIMIKRYFTLFEKSNFCPKIQFW